MGVFADGEDGMKIEQGKYYRTRDGRKVGPMRTWGETFQGHDCLTSGGFLWRVSDGINYPDENGKSNKPKIDLISEWTDPAPEPAKPDLTAITTPFGLLDAETQGALRAHGGPYEIFGACGWVDYDPTWHTPCTYRVKPSPPKPREAWAYGAHMRDTREAAEQFRADVDAANPGKGYLNTPITHWIEVTE
jgi:hypothetical protein